MDRRSRTSANPPSRGRRRLWTLLAAGVLIAAGAVPLTLSSLAQADPNSGSNSNRPVHDVLTNLFEWNWPSVANECTTVLGPKGYGGVQVAPPQDSVKRTSTSATAATRSCTRGGRSTSRWTTTSPAGWAPRTSSRPWSHLPQGRREGLRRRGHQPHDRAGRHVLRRRALHARTTTPTVHACELPQSRPASARPPTGGIEDFNNLPQVFHCELLGLADLRTETDYVRDEAGRLPEQAASATASPDSGWTRPSTSARRTSARSTPDCTTRSTVSGRTGRSRSSAVVPACSARRRSRRPARCLGLDGVKQLRDAFKSYPADHVGSIATLRAFGEESGLTAEQQDAGVRAEP